MEIKLNNPAGRLQSILVKVKGVRGDEYMDEVWARALGVPSQNKTELLVCLGKVYALPD